MKSLLYIVIGCVVKIHLINGWPVDSKITNGYNAKDADFPWHVSVIGQIGPNVTQLCSGSLISIEWILTAAHCARGMISINIGIGSTNLSQPIINYTIYDYVIHPDYDSENKHNDVALLKLPERVKLGPKIRTVSLPKKRLSPVHLQNTIGRVSGFGRLSDDSPVVSQILQWIYVRIIENIDCQRVYGETVIVNSTMCAIGLFSSAQNTCNGDSGGALVIHHQGRVTQIGVIAFAAKDQCTMGYPGGYMRVSSYINWIQSTTRLKFR